MHMTVTLVRLGDQRFFIVRGTCHLDAISRTNPAALILDRPLTMGMAAVLAAVARLPCS